MEWLRNLLGCGNRKHEPSSIVTVEKEGAAVYVIRVGGMLSKTSMDRIQAVASQDIARGAKDLKILIILKDFFGWKRGQDWGDVNFFVQHEASIARLAVVGDARWQTEILTFLGAGHRSGEVRCFAAAQEAQARDWLAS